MALNTPRKTIQAPPGSQGNTVLLLFAPYMYTGQRLYLGNHLAPQMCGNMTEWLRCQIRIYSYLILFEGAGSNPAVVGGILLSNFIRARFRYWRVVLWVLPKRVPTTVGRNLACSFFPNTYIA